MFIIISFDREICASIKKLMPETPVYIIIGGAPGEEFSQTVQFALDNGLDGVDFAFVWGREWVRLTQKSGLKTMVWIADDVKTAEKYFRMGVRDITTNSLTPVKPEGNLFQNAVRAFRDFLYNTMMSIGNLFSFA